MVRAVQDDTIRVHASLTVPLGTSAQDLAIPLGWSHTPLEVQFWQRQEQGWTQEADVFQASELVLAPFIKLAVRYVRVQGQFQMKQLNVLSLWPGFLLSWLPRLP